MNLWNRKMTRKRGSPPDKVEDLSVLSVLSVLRDLRSLSGLNVRRPDANVVRI
jgi:hypothetical protein